ncbi:hypothetical protein BX600DRAFT_157240 [Xylariales sp. PMI_506]|nr:hypothetical protein BX600DRAFT_157240 [Xylariales sp. PMI_506]
MKSTTSASLALLLATAAVAFPLQARQSSCSTDGALVCNGVSQFALCDNGSATWQSVAAGTECVCDGDACTIQASSTTGTVAAAAAADTSSAAAATSSGLNIIDPGAAATDTLAAAAYPSHTATRRPASSTTTLVVATSPKTTAVASTYSAVAPTTTTTAVAATTTAASSTATGGSTYIQYFTGNGDVSAGWPAESAWLDFDTMWETNLANIISTSCAQFDATDNSATESADIKSAIQSIASSSGVDERFILAIVMQESNGCVRVPTTNYGVTNPGLMQSHDGSHSCAGVSSCSSDEITGMIQDGTQGTSSGDGLQQILAEVTGSDATAYYLASVVYNSGSLPSSGLLQDATATACYASDVANRLIGWSVGTSGCTA